MIKSYIIFVSIVIIFIFTFGMADDTCSILSNQDCATCLNKSDCAFCEDTKKCFHYTATTKPCSLDKMHVKTCFGD